MDVPKLLGERFEVGELLVKRPSCQIYKAIDKQLGDREVAIKFFEDGPEGDEDLIKSFDEDVEKLQQASHRALVPIIAGGTQDDHFYLAMELIEGETLRELIEREGAMEVERALHIIEDLAEGLAEVHELVLFHGHVDSRAVMFKGKEVRLAGYYPPTIRRVFQKRSSMTTTAARTLVEPAYVAPEQIAAPDDIDGRADIYALSVLLFEMVTGQRPFHQGNALQIATQRMSQPPPSPRDVNDKLSPLIDAAILKGLAREPDERFQSANELVDAAMGGKVGKNPLAPQPAATGGEGGERMSTETIAVSMSASDLKQMLSTHEDAEPAPQAQDATQKAAPVNGQAAAAGSAALDVDATAMGVEAQGVGVGSASAEPVSSLRASFVIINGKRRGEKLFVDQEQTMVGSDPSCHICIADKDVPKRYALVVNKDSGYVVAALSATPVTINGEEVEDAEETPLKRGDVLNVGSNELRYIAPGEVFTLRDEVADRVIDRPKSRAPKIMMTVAIALLVIGGSGTWLYLRSVESHKKTIARQEAKKKKQREELIAKFVREGDAFFKQGALIEPVGENARDRFQQVLELNPDNGYAKRRLAEIKERLVSLESDKRRRDQLSQRIDQLIADAERYYRAGNYISPPGSNARDTYREILRMDAENEVALQKIAEIEKLLGDILSRVEVLLARARVYMDMGQFIRPESENAFDLIQKVIKVDPENKTAVDFLHEMAAYSVFEGDRAKQTARPKQMRAAYNVAQAVGVNPDLIKPRLAGVKLMEQSKASVIIYAGGDDKKKKDEDASTKNRYLDSEEIERRVSQLNLQAGGGARKDRSFIDIGR